MIVSAQDKIKISKEEIGTWFERNWMWVAIGAVALILLIALLSRGTVSRLGSRRTTTVIKDDRGKQKCCYHRRAYQTVLIVCLEKI
jgi:hypothetical protein